MSNIEQVLTCKGQHAKMEVPLVVKPLKEVQQHDEETLWLHPH